MQCSDYGQIFLKSIPLLDVRAEIEFAVGAFPKSVNIPVLSTEERAQVGTTYKQHGPEAAIRLGEELISGQKRQERLEAWATFLKQNPLAMIYCFRGGLRSQSVQSALRDIGVEVELVRGGFKAMRRYLMSRTEETAAAKDFLVVSGRTGTGKTELLHCVNLQLPVVDLEALAEHRGSAFGRTRCAQPTQVSFENALAVALLRLKSSSGPLIVEDESRLIGAREVPAAIFKRMCAAPLVLIEASVSERARDLLETYLRENYLMTPANSQDPLLLGQLKNDLQASLTGISRRLGGQRTQEIDSMMQMALSTQSQNGEVQVHLPWVERLLVEYYDPLYDYHLNQNQTRVVFRGTKAEVQEFLLQQ